MKKLNDELAAQKALEAQIKQEAAEIKTLIDNKSVTLKAKSGPDGKLYGAVTSKDISEAVNQSLNVDIDKRKVVSDNIKTTGAYTVKIKLHPEVEAQVNVVIENE
jgi:large subunit ribosomal protein L9